MPPERRSGLASVDSALELLLLLYDAPVIRVTSAARTLGIAPSTAHRQLSALVARGFLVQDRMSKAYRAGPTLIDLGLKVSGSFDLREASEPHLRRLTARLGQTASVVVLRGPDVRFVAGFESDNRVRSRVITGEVLPAYSTSGGKVLLAELSREALRELYPRPLKKLTPKTRSFTALLDDLELVMMRGYAVNDGESDASLAAVAVPLRDAAGRTIAAVASSCEASRMSPGRLREVVIALRECSARIRDERPRVAVD